MDLGETHTLLGAAVAPILFWLKKFNSSKVERLGVAKGDVSVSNTHGDCVLPWLQMALILFLQSTGLQKFPLCLNVTICRWGAVFVSDSERSVWLCRNWLLRLSEGIKFNFSQEGNVKKKRSEAVWFLMWEQKFRSKHFFYYKKSVERKKTIYLN